MQSNKYLMEENLVFHDRQIHCKQPRCQRCAKRVTILRKGK